MKKMKTSKDKDDLYFYQRYPNLPLYISLISLICSLIMLSLQITILRG